jgi:hypothetical protein
MTGDKTMPNFIRFEYSQENFQGLISVETKQAVDAGEYDLEVFYSSQKYPPASKGPTAV